MPQDHQPEVIVRQCTGTGGADTVDSLPGPDTELPQEQPGDEAAAIHPVLAHHVDALGGSVSRDRFECSLHDIGNAVGRGERTVEVGEDAREPTAGRLTVDRVDLTGTVDHPGATERFVRKLHAEVAVRPTHPDFGRPIGAFASRQDEAGAWHVQRLAMERWVFEHAIAGYSELASLASRYRAA